MAKEPFTIAGKTYEVEHTELPQSDLLFYLENPRVYSALRIDGAEPSQKEIEKQMKKMEHVKKLRLSIEANGGLIDPIIVRGKDKVVLEGNSRLAAYRLLCEKDPIRWGMVKCVVLPDDVDDNAVFSLLGQYHIVGRKDWSPYEQAGYLYRRKQKTKYPVEEMAKELGIVQSEAKRYLEVYEFMLSHGVLDPTKWSYYEELLKNRGIKNKAKKDPTFLDVVTRKIEAGTIEEAKDIRKLGEMVSVDEPEAKELVQDFLEDKISLVKAHIELQESGILNDDLVKLTKFRELVGDVNFANKLSVSSADAKDKAKFELSRIKTIIDSLLTKLS